MTIPHNTLNLDVCCILLFFKLKFSTVPMLSRWYLLLSDYRVSLLCTVFVFVSVFVAVFVLFVFFVSIRQCNVVLVSFCCVLFRFLKTCCVKTSQFRTVFADATVCAIIVINTIIIIIIRVYCKMP